MLDVLHRETYDSIGTGTETIVWLHGFLENRTMWQKLSAQFPKHRHLLIDLPGHGVYSVNHEILSMELMAEHVRSVLLETNVVSPILVGHSMGGYVSLAYQEKYADAKALILIHSTCLADSPEKQRNRDRVSEIVLQNKLIFIREAIPSLFLNPSAHADLISQLVADVGDMSEKSIVAALQGMKFRLERTEVLKTTLSYIIMGKHDTAIDVELLKSSVADFLEVKTYMLNESAHMGMYEQPKVFKDVLREILAKCG